jgi:hypothetical protein
VNVRLLPPRKLLAPLGLAGLVVALCLPTADDARGQGARPKAKKEEDAPKEGKDKAVADGLRWLALHQAPDGRWSLNHFNRTARTAPLPAGRAVVCNCGGQSSRDSDIAATAFGILPFLGAGYTHKAGPQKPDYSKTVNAGLRFLLTKQGREGSFGTEMYANALATIAVCEAFGMTTDAKLKAPAQRAVNFIVAAQDPAGGGWRYAPRQAGDLSVTGYYLTALKSAQMAGLNVSKKVLAQAEKFVGTCATADKGFSYVPGGGASPTMTAVGTLCQFYQGVNPRNPTLQAGVALLKKTPPGSRNDLYYEYYASQALFHVGGENWKSWNDGDGGMRELLLKKQDQGGTLGRDHQKGSWFTALQPQSAQGGRVMYTALALLVLELDDANLPLFRKDRAAPKKE